MRAFALAAAAALAAVGPVSAKRIAAPPPPVQRALAAEVVVVGKVMAIEKESVGVAPAPGAEKVEYRVAVVKVESGLAGAANLTHVKVGFPAAAGPRRGLPVVALMEGQEGLFFLNKHPGAGFYSYNWMTSPVDATAPDYKAQVAVVKKALTAVADPMPALKAGRAEDRTLAAVALVLKYRTAPPTGGEVEPVKVPADESRLVLKALAEADWSKAEADQPRAVNAFYMLALGQNDGWTPPKPAPGTDYNSELRAAFAKWVAGPGKDYQISKLVAKKK